MLTFFCKPQVASFYSSLKQPYTKLCHRQNLDRQRYLWNNLRMFLLIRLYKLRKKYIAQLKYWCLKQLGGKKLWIDLFFFRLRYFSGEQFHICKLFQCIHGGFQNMWNFLMCENFLHAIPSPHHDTSWLSKKIIIHLITVDLTFF